MTDFAAARRHMVDGQIRTADVTDLRIQAAMLGIPRERFLPASMAGLAYLDLDLPVASGRRLLKPMVLAKLLQAADIKPTDRVLDVGGGSGYGAAILARMAAEVIALEENVELADAARRALAGNPNVTVITGGLVAGSVQHAPFDVIVLEGATEVEPEAAFRQLKDGGRLVCVLGAGPGARAMLYCRVGDDVGGRAIFDTSGTVLPGFAKPPAFAF